MLGLPEAEIAVAIMRRNDRSSDLEVRVMNTGVDVLAPAENGGNSAGVAPAYPAVGQWSGVTPSSTS